MAQRGDPDPAAVARRGRGSSAAGRRLAGPRRALDRQRRSIERRVAIRTAASWPFSPSSHERSPPPSIRSSEGNRPAPTWPSTRRRAQEEVARGAVRAVSADPELSDSSRRLRAERPGGHAVLKSAQRHDDRGIGVVALRANGSRSTNLRSGRSSSTVPTSFQSSGSNTVRVVQLVALLDVVVLRLEAVASDDHGLASRRRPPSSVRPAIGSFWSTRSSSSISSSSKNRQNSVFSSRQCQSSRFAEQLPQRRVRRTSRVESAVDPVSATQTSATVAPGLGLLDWGSGSSTPARGRSPQRATASPRRASSQSRSRHVEMQSSRL